MMIIDCVDVKLGHNFKEELRSTTICLQEATKVNWNAMYKVIYSTLRLHFESLTDEDVHFELRILTNGTGIQK